MEIVCGRNTTNYSRWGEYVGRYGRGYVKQTRRFFGAGCPHPGVDCLTQQVSLVLMHYRSNTAVGKMLRILMEIMIIELGMGMQPFWVDYNKYGQLVMDSWLKSL